eukprot:5265081-Pyramimonas_sp.AAC.2
MFRPRVGSSFGCRFRRFRLGCCGRLGFGPWSCGYRFGLLRVCRFIRFPRACAPAGGRVPPLSVPPLSAAPALSPVTFTAALAFLALRPELVCALRRISPPGGQISPPRCRFTVRLAAGGHTVGGSRSPAHQPRTPRPSSKWNNMFGAIRATCTSDHQRRRHGLGVQYMRRSRKDPQCVVSGVWYPGTYPVGSLKTPVHCGTAHLLWAQGADSRLSQAKGAYPWVRECALVGSEEERASHQVSGRAQIRLRPTPAQRIVHKAHDQTAEGAQVSL